MSYYIPDAARKAAARHGVDGQLVDWHVEADHGSEPHDPGYADAAENAAKCIASGDCSLLPGWSGRIDPVVVCQFNSKPHKFDDECQNVTRIPDWIVLERRFDCKHAGYGYPGIPGLTFCRCLICARCKQHTGNTNQGHHWGYCKVTKTIRDFHFCCPGNCELETP